jgi:hypothetical protein
VPTAPPGPELSSLASSLDQVAQRVTAIADEHAHTPREDVAHELYEIERVLQAALRRLEKLVTKLR